MILRGTVDVDPDVALLRDERLAGVHSHAHAYRGGAERGLRAACRSNRVRRAREREEERVSLRVHLDAAVLRGGVAQDAPVGREHSRVPVSELVEEPVEPSMSVKSSVTVPLGSSASTDDRPLGADSA